jgi:hypothetical protein
MAKSIAEIFGNSSARPDAEPAPQTEDTEQLAPPEVEVELPTPEPETRAATGDKPQDGPPPSEQPQPADDETRQIAAFKRKAEDETRKRQGVEQQLAEANQRLQAMEQERRQPPAQAQPAPQRQPAPQQQQRPQPQPQQPIPDFLDSEQAAAWVQSSLDGRIAIEREAVARALHDNRVMTSQAIMRMQHADYDEAEAAFEQAAEANPSLWARLERHPFPAQFAYEVGKQSKQIAEIAADPAAYEASLRQKIMAELAAQQPPSAPVVQPPRRPNAPPPSSLARVTSQTPRNIAKVWDGPRPVSDILAPKRTK